MRNHNLRLDLPMGGRSSIYVHVVDTAANRSPVDAKSRRGLLRSEPYRLPILLSSWLLKQRARLRSHVLLAQTLPRRAARAEPSGSVVRGRLHEMRLVACWWRRGVHAP